jgi:hypothetical protein
MMHDPNRGARVIALFITALSTAACLGDTELVTPPPLPTVTITLEFLADSADLPTAGALGWATGIPNVEVTILHEDSAGGTARTLLGSEAGTLTVEQLPAGRYRLDAVRWLTAEERAHLSAGDDAVGFVARAALSTAAASAQTPVPLVASRRRGIVIGEWQGDPLFTQREGDYIF